LLVSWEVVQARSRDGVLCRSVVLADGSAGDLAGAETGSSAGERPRVGSGLSSVRRTERVLVDFFALILARANFTAMLMRAAAISVSTSDV